MRTLEIFAVLEASEHSSLKVRVKVVGSNASFTKEPSELYTNSWLERFSPEDIAYIGFLSASENLRDEREPALFPHTTYRLTESVIFLAILFVSFLLMSNMTAFRVAEITLPWIPFLQSDELQFPAGLVLFPVTYALSTILTEVYGYHISRLIIWGGLAANFLFVLAITASSFIPTSATWIAHTAISTETYEEVFARSANTFFASSIAYFFSDFLNTMTLAKLKVLSAGKNTAWRMITSTGIAVILDSVIFCTMLFGLAMSGYQLVTMIAVQIAVKFTYELLLLPVTLRVSTYLKKRDGIDYYDFDTRFNPFVLRG